MKNNTVLKRKVMEIVWCVFWTAFMVLLVIKFREPIYDLMWTDKYSFRPSVEKSVEATYDNLDKVVVPVGKKVANGMIKVGEFLDKIPPQF